MYDIVIIGGGPAGLTAAIYALRARLKTLLIEKFMLGGQVAMATTIENYPGFNLGIKGPDLVRKLEKQVRHIEGAEIISEEVIGIDIRKEFEYTIRTIDKEYLTSTVLICTGRRYRKLGLDNEDLFVGRGISYCATCDAPLYKNKEVIVVGGGDTAVEESLYLTKYADKVNLVHRRKELRATKILQERLLSNPKINFISNSVISKLVIGKTDIIPSGIVTGVNIKNVITNNETELLSDGIFVCIGFNPNTEFLKNVTWLDTEGYIPTDENMQTSVKGIYAAGDCRRKLLQQIVTACGDAASAVFSIQQFLLKR